MISFANSEDPDKMQHNAAFYQDIRCKGKKNIFRQKNTIFFFNYNLTPLDMYNGISQVYCIKPEGIIH